MERNTGRAAGRHGVGKPAEEEQSPLPPECSREPQFEQRYTGQYVPAPS